MRRGRKRNVVVGGLVLAALAAVAFVIPRGHSQPPYTPRPVAIPAIGPTVFKIHVPAHAKVLFFGDSFTQGYAATPENTAGYAPLVAQQMGWQATIDGVSGSGYIKSYPTSPNYPQRAESLPAKYPGYTPDLVIIQGGLNDQPYTQAQVESAGDNTIRLLRQTYPHAAFVMFGPVLSPPDSPRAVLHIGAVNAALMRVAFGNQIPYVDAASEQWFKASDEGTLLTLIDRTHPTTAGHALIARRLIADLRPSLD